MNKKILVIEDDNRISGVMRTIFQLNKIEADFAATGEDGLSLLADGTDYKMILSDIMLPGIDGYAILKEVKANEKTKKIPFVFLSAFADDADIHKGIQHGADDYITKPFAAKTLVDIVRVYLESE
ncbi:MAG: response regulator [Flavipsychrobacter sp.]